MQLNLRSKTDEVLVSELKALVQRERDLLMEVLYYLKEVDRRQIYLPMGKGSINQFAMGELGYDSTAAHCRVDAMRLIKDLPEMEDRLQDGQLCFTNAVKAQGFIRQENQRR